MKNSFRKIACLVFISATVPMAGSAGRVYPADNKPNKAKRTGVAMQEMGRILTSGGMTYKAPNTADRPYYVFAVKAGKVLWEINKKTLSPAKQNPELKEGGIDRFEIQTVKEGDLDSGAGDYAQMRKYIGKRALYIYYSKNSVVNRLPSWLIVDMDTGKQINFIAFN